MSPQARRSASQGGSEQEQKAALEAALLTAGGNVAITATNLGFARSHVHRLLTKYKLREIAAQMRRERGARELQSGPRAGVVGLGRPSKKAHRKRHIR